MRKKMWWWSMITLGYIFSSCAGTNGSGGVTGEGRGVVYTTAQMSDSIRAFGESIRAGVVSDNQLKKGYNSLYASNVQLTEANRVKDSLISKLSLQVGDANALATKSTADAANAILQLTISKRERDSLVAVLNTRIDTNTALIAQGKKLALGAQVTANDAMAVASKKNVLTGAGGKTTITQDPLSGYYVISVDSTLTNQVDRQQILLLKQDKRIGALELVRSGLRQ